VSPLFGILLRRLVARVVASAAVLTDPLLHIFCHPLELLPHLFQLDLLRSQDVLSILRVRSALAAPDAVKDRLNIVF
jgi:hypothetical protein